MLTVEQLAAIAGRPANGAMRAVVAGIEARGAVAGLTLPHRLAQFLAQVTHESNAYRDREEIWGPTAAQLRYEGRADLGNTAPGDGYRYRGRGAIQITGGSNYAQFTDWARQLDRFCPDFTANPDAVLTAPWEGLAPVWYWESRPALSEAADRGDLEAVTRIVNGGLNGLADRRYWYARAALVLLGREPADVRGFQRAAGLLVDGDAGPQTRAALHRALVAAIPAPEPEPDPAAEALAQDRAGLAGFWAWIIALLKGGKA